MIPFISVDDLGTYMDQDLSSSDLAVIAVNAACQSVRTYLNRPLNLITETVTVDGTGTDALLLNGPVVDVDSISIDGTEVDASEYVLGLSSVYRLNSWWPPGRRNIEVVYTHGYAVDESDVGADSGDVGAPDRMPDDIREVALELAQAVVNSGGSSASGAITSETIGEYAYTVDAGSAQAAGGGLNDNQKARLNPYRYRAVA